MIAELYPFGQVWLKRRGPLLVTLKAVPFSVVGVVCVCHSQTWIVDTASGVLLPVRWDD